MQGLVVERAAPRACSRRRQMQVIGAAVHSPGVAAHQPQGLEVIDDRDQIGALDPECRADPRLAETRIAVNDGQYGELARPRDRSTLAGNEVGEYGQLRLPQHVADLFVEACKVGSRVATVHGHGKISVTKLLCTITLYREPPASRSAGAQSASPPVVLPFLVRRVAMVHRVQPCVVMSVTLYHWEPNANSGKPMLTLAEKGVAYDSHYLDFLRFDQHQPAHLAVNPDGTIPALVHGTRVLTESTPMMEYIDDEFPGPPLKPHDPNARWRMRWWMRFFDADFAPSLSIVGWQIFVGPAAE